ncbi:hypothetical protein CTATCC11996_06923 [Comamonas testosteroni ATCC 11996]|nr:hypothetical protein CTATCC11996_06923 [Comamonas testosteroni ATCC 11996]
MSKEWIQVPARSRRMRIRIFETTIFNSEIARSILTTTGTGNTFVIAETRVMKIKAACGHGRAPD